MSDADVRQASSAEGGMPDYSEHLLDLTPSAAAALMRENGNLQAQNLYNKRRLVRLTSVIAILITALIAGGSYAAFAYPKYRYIYTANNAAVCQVAPQDAPRATAASVADFAREGTINAYTYDYVNYQASINYAMGRWFSDEGRISYLRTLDQSGNLKRVRDGRLTLRTMSTQAPQVEEVGRLADGSTFWIVHVPLAVEFYAGGEEQPRSRSDYIAITTVVQGMPSRDKPSGLSIDLLSLKPSVRR